MELNILTWIDKNFEEFDSSLSDGSNSFESLKPIGELSLILWGLKKNNPEVNSKVNEIASKIFDRLKTINSSKLWPLLTGNYISDAMFGGYALFFIIEKLTGLKLSYSNELKAKLLSKHLEYPTDIAVIFTNELCTQNQKPIHYYSSCVRLLDEIDSDKDITYSWKYAMTHVVFFGSWMGIKSLDWVEIDNKLARTLKFALYDSMNKGELDICAELISVMVYLKIPLDMESEKCLTLLKSNLKYNLEISEILGNKAISFKQNYHLILTTLLAINLTQKT